MLMGSQWLRLCGCWGSGGSLPGRAQRRRGGIPWFTLWNSAAYIPRGEGRV